MRSFIILSVCFFANLSIAATCISLSSGNWSDPATWSCGVQPSAGDSIIINGGDTVTISDSPLLKLKGTSELKFFCGGFCNIFNLTLDNYHSCLKILGTG